MNKKSELTGVKKAAILLLTIDENISKEILKTLDEKEIELLATEISELKTIPEELVQKVHEEFRDLVNRGAKRIVDGEDLLKRLLKHSLGEKAEIFFEKMESKKGIPGEFIRTCDPKILAYVLKGEHPQTIALVLSTLGARKASEALLSLPEDLQGEIIVRMAKLEKVDKKILEEIESVLKEQLEKIGVVEGRQLGGTEMVANMLNQMEKAKESQLLTIVEEKDPELAEKIRQLMFTFEDLLKVDDKGIQTLLKEISSEDLAVALKGASLELKEKIFKNMSERARNMLVEDIESMGPVRISDVEKAQQKIAMLAKKLEAEGKIVLSRGDERFI